MKTKRKTKAQREAEQKAALRQRVADIAIGAAGYNFDDESEFATAEFLERFVPALRVCFGTDGNDYLWSAHCLGKWNDIDSSTQALWENGVRA